MDKMVDEIDNEAVIKVDGHMLMQKKRHLYWSACSTHCLDLILEEIGNRKSVKKVLDEAKKITSFIYNHTWSIDYMKKYTKGVDFLRPGITRFATNFIALESIVRSKQALKEMVTSSTWKRYTYARKPTGLEMTEVINLSELWKKVVDVLKIQEPLLWIEKSWQFKEIVAIT
ncbi:WEB family protein [Gossypium australe]|uniref:WEB family protein n=1 Tax=Gossypium australe TaxID=47621 RepID=A0A5B6U7F8_9ROSI|nr:WEB family protein [Gossypium australe]